MARRFRLFLLPPSSPAQISSHYHKEQIETSEAVVEGWNKKTWNKKSV
jgi:hypothetical protein